MLPENIKYKIRMKNTFFKSKIALEYPIGPPKSVIRPSKAIAALKDGKKICFGEVGANTYLHVD